MILTDAQQALFDKDGRGVRFEIDMPSWELLDRYEGRRVEEPIYGEKWLRWAYEKKLGRLTTKAIASRAWFSRWYGWKMSRPSSAKLIAGFVEQFGIDLSEARKALHEFTSFNDFFTRELKPEARPMPLSQDGISFPADGRHRLIQNLKKPHTLWAKNEPFTIASMLGPLAFGAGRKVLKGDAVISRLAPIDYHRFHLPWSGRILAQATLEGPLYSVHPIALQHNIRYLLSNKRTVSVLQDATLGVWAMIEIGATNVGSIHQSLSEGQTGARGDEKGYFSFGGSCVVSVFPKGAIEFADDLKQASDEGIELYEKMGDVMGYVQSVSPEV